MNLFLVTKRIFSRTTIALLTASTTLALTACQKDFDYFPYVSELRSNVLLCKTDEFSLKVYATDKEYPYQMDGIVREHSPRTELWLTAPSGDKDYTVSFIYENKSYGGDMSYDGVKGEYYYSCALDISKATTIPITLTFKEEKTELIAQSVVTDTTLSPSTALKKLVQTEKATFDKLTDKYGFAGEIYLRLLYEDSPYYYFGVIDRNGKCIAYLLNATTGKLLAKRES